MTPIDALIGINRLNDGNASSDLGSRDADSTEPFFDVNGDGSHSPIDVLLVVNRLKSGPLLNVQADNDTGIGTSGMSDGLTADPSLSGRVDGNFALLQGKIGEGDEWFDLTGFVDAEQRIAMSAEDIATALGSEDGTLYLRALASEGDVFPDTVAILRRCEDTARPGGAGSLNSGNML